ncbi:dolichyl-phosphate-mannose--protein O-mannosyl transferase [Micromonospora vinacea]|uniref:Polyprenol-phosphate-mannose--protein mannosyltransferase n=2 Tax=Micromonospora vinacea TaxID=709878 RepID=A0ABS0K0N5_9ACTN|nr:phospholipid carrier-dependent glycosyltransferase [Micromonospora vinacea]MBG6102169.1 dolichyl-phosphate-mannose--protein O-mannosyl transferase [Micromonospora vinacea]
MTSASTAQSPSADPDKMIQVTGEPGATQEPTAPNAEGGGVAAMVRRRFATVDTQADRFSWLATAVVVAIAAIVRFVGLSSPKGKIFDETYYAKDAYGLISRGVEWNYKDNVPSYVVHPPLGKWLIGIGEWAFGYQDADSKVSVPGHLMTTAPEFGWRFSAAVIGTLSVLLLVRIGRRMFRSTVLGCAAGLLLALDGFHMVLSRAALLDIFLLFFVLAAFGALVLDRDARRRRWARALDDGLDPSQPGRAGRPPTGWRTWPWWRLAAGVLIGCACAVKWSALYFVPAFALLVLFWEVGVRRSAGVRRPWRDTLVDELPWLVLAGVLMVGTYIATWSGWLLTDDGYYRLASSYPGAPLSDRPVIGPLINLFEYHRAAYGFHAQLDDAHKYQSWPWQWLLLGRPVAFHYANNGVCGAATCSSEILLLGTPLLWWSFLPALVALVWLGVARRDWRAGAILLTVAAGLLPWFWFALDGRTMFSFYAAPAVPFLVLAVVYVLGALIAPPGGDVGAVAPLVPGDPSYERRLVGSIAAGAYVLLVAACFAYFYPIFVGRVIPYSDWLSRMWLDGRWI